MTAAHSAHRKGYADTRAGQVFYRVCGEGRPLVLLHWTPLSSRMFGPVMDRFAARGFRVWALDLLGYGRSDPRPEDWSMEAYGANVIESMGALGIDRAAILGGHNGASAALEAALAAPARIEAVVLDGCPVLSDELRAAFRQLAASGPPGLAADGSHRSLPFDRAFGLLAEYIPGFKATDDTLPMIWAAAIDYLETDFISSGPIAGTYDITQRLPQLNAPTLMLSADNDTLRATFETAADLVSDARRHIFIGDHPIHFPDRAEDYAAVVAGFLTGHGGEREGS